METIRKTGKTAEAARLPESPAAVRGRVLALAGPALAELFLMTFVSMADMIMVSRLGPAATVSIGLTNQPTFLALAAFMALNVGSTALVARSVGAGQPERASDVARQTLMVTVFLAILVGLAGFLGAPYVLRFMGAEPEVLATGTSYFRITSVGLIFNTVAMALSAVLRGSGDTQTPMKVNIAANLINIVGNFLLINGIWFFPRWEVNGAGIATVFARFVACAGFLYVVYSGRSNVRLSLSDRYRFDFDLLKRIFRIGINAMLEQFMLRGGQVMFARVVAGLGTVTYASHQIALNILALSFMPGQAFAIAATTLVGQSLGAKNSQRAEQCGYEARLLGMGVATTVALLFFFGGSWIARLYTSDPQVVAGTALALKIIALAQPSQSTQFILAGGLRGAGDTRWPLYSTAFGIWGVRVFLAYLLIQVFGLGLVGAWVAMTVDQITRSFIISYRFKQGHWKALKV
ncbi:MAG: MATE family efflux transporter [Bacillota bacterium]